MRLKFYIEGSRKSGTVHLEMVEVSINFTRLYKDVTNI